MLPGGSGCALLYQALMMRNLDFTDENAIYIATRMRPANKTVFKHTIRPSNKVVYGLLNFLAGFIADVDFGSEKCRCLGHLRFDVYAAWKLCCCPASRKYSVNEV